MSFSSFFNRSQKQRKVRRADHGHAGRRPRFETFEDRRMLSFTSPVSYDAGTSPQAVVTADFNGDGRLDLAVANPSTNSVNVLLGNGNGTLQAAKTSSAGANPVSLAVGDFNADGTLDLAAADGGARGVNVMFGNRDGTFRAPTHIAVGWTQNGQRGPGSLATGDFNGDGKMDLVVTSNYRPADYYSYPQGRADVLLAIGDGSFAAPRTFWFPDRAIGVAVVADMNGDGNPDLVTEMPDYSSLIVLLGDGQGYLRLPPGGGWTAAYANAPSAAGDLNGDGKTDVVTGGGVLLGNGAGGFVSWIPEYPAAGSGPGSVALGDFDHEGGLDIATTYGIYRNVGNGKFSAAELFAAGPGAAAVAAGDFNGDGWLDLATANSTGNSASVLINDQSWSSAPPIVSVSKATVTEGNTGAVSATFTLTLSKAVDVDVTVQYSTADITAVAGSDYTAASGAMTIPAGQTSATFTIAVTGDRLVEPTETFAVNLSAPTNATIGDGQGIGAILDNEPRISINNVSKYEGKNRKTTLFTFTVTLSAAYDQAVTMSFRTVDGTATTGDGDYVAKTGTLTFAPGETTKTITIEVKGDNKKEAHEAFYLDLFGSSSNSLFTKNRGIGTILNDDR